MFFDEVPTTEPARKLLASHNLFTPLVKLLADALKAPQSDHSELLTINILRALGNMCYDNEDNRDALLLVDNAIPSIVECLTRVQDSSHLRLLTIACGALLNISMDNESVQLEVISHSGPHRLIHLMNIATSPDTQAQFGSLAATSIATLANLLEVEPGIKSFLAVDGLASIFRVLQKQHAVLTRADVQKDEYVAALEVLEPIAAALELLGENDTVQRNIVIQDLLNVLLDFVDHRPTYVLPISEDLDEDDEDEVPKYTEIRKRISRIVTLVTMNDANMTEIPTHPLLMTRFKQWLTLGVSSPHPASLQEEDEIRMSAALCIGNLARSDDACNVLVGKHEVAPALLALLEMEVERVKKGSAGMAEGDVKGVGEVKSCVKVIHAVVGAFKNLSIAVADRKTLGAIGVINPIAKLLDLDVLKPVHFQCIGVLKNLCAGSNELNAYRIITGLEPPAGETKVSKLPTDGTSALVIQSKTPLNKLVKYIWKATGDNLTGVRNEGGRVIVNLVRTCHLAGAPQLIKLILDSNGVTPLIQIVTGALLTRVAQGDSQGGQAPGESQPELHHHVHFDAVPSDGQVFPVVQNEGLVALILMMNALPMAIQAISKFHASLIPTCQTILLSGIEAPPPVVATESALPQPVAEQIVYSDEVKVNVCLFLGVLVSADANFRQLALPVLRPALETLTKWTSVSNLTAAAAVSEKGALAFQESANRSSSMSGGLNLRGGGSKSAKQREEGVVGAGVVGTGLAEAVQRLRVEFEKKA
ncbi:Rap1 GTPase-GDP dissociation stimulator 1 [Podochytrium sp. JEL0797]|nr:Rap1 GTPase-GDP dissociation stimulator 1 [Podochytrium sp. JEL0797]